MTITDPPHPDAPVTGVTGQPNGDGVHSAAVAADDETGREGNAVLVGVVDGTADCTTTGFDIVVTDGASVELDDLVAVDQTLPDGTGLTHYGIVAELGAQIEGASWKTDTARIAEQTMPGETVRHARTRVLRPMPERWVAPEPAAAVRRVQGAERDVALFADQMQRRLPVGLDARGEPVYVDFDFVNGRKGGHVNVSGISGVTLTGV